MNVVLVHVGLDNRFGHSNIASRLGVSRQGLTFTRWTNFYERLKGGKELFFDDNQVVGRGDAVRAISWPRPPNRSPLRADRRAQFLDPEQVRQLHKLAHVADIPVIC